MKKIETKRVPTKWEDQPVCPLCDRVIDHQNHYESHCDPYSPYKPEIDKPGWRILTTINNDAHFLPSAILIDPDGDLWYMNAYQDYEVDRLSFEPLSKGELVELLDDQINRRHQAVLLVEKLQQIINILEDQNDQQSV